MPHPRAIVPTRSGRVAMVLWHDGGARWQWRRRTPRVVWNRRRRGWLRRRTQIAVHKLPRWQRGRLGWIPGMLGLPLVMKRIGWWMSDGAQRTEVVLGRETVLAVMELWSPRMRNLVLLMLVRGGDRRNFKFVATISCRGRRRIMQVRVDLLADPGPGPAPVTIVVVPAATPSVVF